MKTKITLFCLLAFLCFIPNATAQCTSGGWYPARVISPEPSWVLQTINDDCYGGDYAEIWGYTNHVYTFSTSIATDYITITSANGTVYASGYAGLTYQPAFNQRLRYYIHSNSNCDDNPISTRRTRYLNTTFSDFNPACAAPPAATVSSITATSANLSWTAPAVVPESGYDLYVSTTNTTPTINTNPSYQLNNTTTTQFLNGLNGATTYYYWLRSKCSIGIGNWVYRGNFATTGSVAGCNSAANGLFPPYTVTPTCTGSYQTITDQSWGGEYTNVNIVANKQYSFSSSVNTDYITITNEAGTVSYANGPQPVIWNSGNTTGVIRYFLHANANCGNENVNRSRYIRCADAVICTPPSNLVVSNITSNSCKITWTAAASFPSNGYDLYIVTTNTAPDANSTATVVSTNPTVSLNVGSGTTYYYWIRSNCGATYGTWISGGSFTTPAALACNGAANGLYPDATFTPACTGNVEQIVTNAWAGEYTNVNVLANKQYTFTSSVATDYLTVTNATGTAVLASGVTPLSWTSGTTTGVVRYHLNTNASCGSQNTSRVRSIRCADAAAACGAPTALTVSNITSNSIRLAWTAPATAPASYELYFTTTNTAPTAGTVATSTNTSTNIAVMTGLNAGTTFYYWIRSNCGTSKSTWTAGGSFTTLAALACNGAISGLYPETTFTPACTGVAESIVTNAWGGEYTNVNILANKQYTFTSSVATDYLTVTNASGSVVYASGLTPLTWTSGTTAAVIRYYLHTNANCGSENVSRTRSIRCNAISTACGAPTDLAVSHVTSNSFRISWSAPFPAPSSGYELYVVPNNTVPTGNTIPTHASLTDNTWVLSGFTGGTNYNYWVRANCGSVKGDWIHGGSFDTVPAQNCNGATFGLWPEDSVQTACDGTNEVISDFSRAGEYSNVYINIGLQYTFTSSIATDYITITNDSGNMVYASGVTPLRWASGSNVGLMRYYIHTSSACGDQSQPVRVKMIKCENALGVNEQFSENEMKMYPNPTAGQFTVETAGIIAENIVIVDNLGRVIRTQKPNSAKTTLAIDGFSDGVYYVNINYQDKTVTKKLVLKKN